MRGEDMGAYVVAPAVVPAVVPLGGGKRRRERECESLLKRAEVSSLEGPGRKPRVHWLSVRRDSGYGGTSGLNRQVHSACGGTRCYE